ncbi:MAG TPA: hypothetical protein DD400_01560 [Rhodospirillaceae bacterium]|nr:hypothetical protein [Rhodospirillaceae bacterium]
MKFQKKMLDENFGDFNKLSSLSSSLMHRESLIYSYLFKKFRPYFQKTKQQKVTCLGSMNLFEVQEIVKDFKRVNLINPYSACLNQVVRLNVNKNVHVTFSPPELEKSYEKSDAIVSVHTLNFFNDAHLVVNSMAQSLCSGGYLFLAVQNAESCVRRLDVSLGFLDNVYQISPQEKLWRQKRWLDLKGLKRLVQQSGLEKVATGGAMLKTQTEAQINCLIENGLVGEDYIHSLFDLGEDYPELCNTVYIVARRPKR